MAIAESGSTHNPFEFSKVIIRSGITREVDAMFTSLPPEFKDGELTVERGGAVFSFIPPISGINRFSVVDSGLETTDRVTATTGFIEIKTLDKMGRTIAHLWNSPPALERLRQHLAVFNPSGSQNSQELLPIA